LFCLVVGGCGDSRSTGSPLGNIGAGLKGPRSMVASVQARGLNTVAALAVDSQGRLWAATAAFNDTGLDGVYVVADAGAPPVKVVSGLHTPMGLLWSDQTLYVSSRAGVDAYSGFDGSRFVDHRTVITLPSGTGTPGGIVLGADGRMRIGVSAPCDNCLPASDFAGAVLSFLPDGTGLQVFARRIRAPVGLAYFPGTDDLFVTMNQRDDLGAATPGDWLAVVKSGDDWKFPDCYGQGGTACAGAPAAVAELDKHAAVSGVAFLTDKSQGTTAAIVAEWQSGKVLAVTLTPNGAGYTSTVAPFIEGIKNPVPVVADSGGLYLGDWSTGIVYRVQPV
jgi:glucose/arabinose dehydrogenase